MPSILQTQRDIIERLDRLQYGSCCPDNTSLFGDEISSDITPGDGDPPATWGDQNVADWDEWYNHLCGASYRYVDLLIAGANQAQQIINQAALTISIIAALLALASGVGIVLAIKYTAASGAFNAVVAVGGTQFFADAATKFEASKDKIVCAVMEDNLRAVMEEELGPLLWSFYQWVDWENATNILWEGGIPGGENLPPAEPTACPNCEEDLSMYQWVTVSEYEATIDGATMQGTHRVTHEPSAGYRWTATNGASGGSDARAHVEEGNLQSYFSLSSSALNLRYFRLVGYVGSSFNSRQIRLTWFDGSGSNQITRTYDISNGANVDISEHIPDEPETGSYGAGFFQIRVLANGEPGSDVAHRFYLQQLTLAGEYRT